MENKAPSLVEDHKRKYMADLRSVFELPPGPRPWGALTPRESPSLSAAPAFFRAPSLTLYDGWARDSQPWKSSKRLLWFSVYEK